LAVFKPELWIFDIISKEQLREWSRMHFKQWSRLSIGILTLSCVMGAPVYAAAVPTYKAGQTGVDISWPKANCTVPTRFLRSWAIIGVDGGLDFTKNPCLRSEAARVSNYSLYANTGYPEDSRGRRFMTTPKRCTPKDEACIAYDYGYANGVYTVKYAAAEGLHATQWWLDVETDNSWTNNIYVNRASIAGEAAAIKHETLIGHVGVYSYPGQWDLLTGNWRNGMPNWAATGSLERSVGKTFCSGEDFTGGGTWLTQYTVRLDEDYVCQTH
jgi:hypothetical protein